MTTMAPLSVRVPHALGRDELRRRLDSRIGELPSHIPGGMAAVQSRWENSDRMVIEVGAMGQTVTARLDLADDHVQVTATLPASLGFLRPVLENAVKARGSQLLLGK